MKNVFDREETETVVSIIAFAALSVLCVFIKYDFNSISEALQRFLD